MSDTISCSRTAEGLLTVGGELSIRTAGELRGILLEAIGCAPELVVECAIDTIDTAGLQVICSFCKTASARGQRYRFASLPEPMTELASALGVPIDQILGRAGNGL